MGGWTAWTGAPHNARGWAQRRYSLGWNSPLPTSLLLFLKLRVREWLSASRRADSHLPVHLQIAQPENEFAQFSKALPCAKARNRDTILAWEMNGEPIPPLHGGPLRLVVPGWYRVWWVKWVRQVRASTEPFDGFWQTRRYTYQDANQKQLGAVTQLRVRSLITSPSSGAQVGKRRIRVDGLAWSGESQVEKVEVTVDRGRNWVEAVLSSPMSPWSWQTWTVVELAGAAGLRYIASRATDSAGRSQDWVSESNRLGYGNNSIQEVCVDVVANH